MTQDNRAQSPLPDPSRAEKTPAVAPALPKKKSRWGRRLLLGVGIVVGFLFLLVASLPTLISMGPARSFVLGKVNDNLNGKVTVADWSIGWTSGIRIDGLKVEDASNRQLLEIAHVNTQLSLLGAARGQFHLGKTTIDGLDFFAQRDADGTLNFSKLAKGPSTSNTPSKSSGKVPFIDGELMVGNSRGTFQTDSVDPITHQPKSDTVYFTSIDGDVKIPDINQPITNTFKIVANTGGPQSGSVAVDGNLQIIKDNVVVPINEMNVAEKVSLTGFDLASIKGFLSSKLSTLAGKTDCALNVQITAGQGAVFEGGAQISSFRLGGEVLEGDTYTANSIAVTIPKTTVDLSPGAGGLDNPNVRVGNGTIKQGIAIDISNTVGGKPSHSTIALAANFMPGLLKNIAANKAPGGTGSVHAVVHLDVVPLATLPHFLHLSPSIQLKSGFIDEALDLGFTVTQVDLQESLDMTNVSAESSADHRQITLQPIKLSLKATDLGGGGAVPDLRDVLLQLSTGTGETGGYATADINGKTLSEVSAKMDVTLDRFQKEWSQIIDFHGVQLGGKLNLAAASTGILVPELAKPGEALASKISLTINGTDLKVTGLNAAPLNEPYLALTTTATLLGSDSNRTGAAFVRQVSNLHTILQTNSAAHPTVDMDITGQLSPIARSSSLKLNSRGWGGDISINRVSVNLAQLQQEFGAFLPLAQDQLTFRNGLLEVHGKINYDGTRAAIDIKLNGSTLTLEKAVGSKIEKVLDAYTMGAALTATYASDGTNTDIAISHLLIGDDASSPQSIIGIENTNDEPIKVVATADGKTTGSGSVHIIRLSLSRLNELAQALTPASADAATPTEPSAKLQSGWLAGTIAFGAQEQKLTVNGNLDVSAITVAVPEAAGLKNEQLKIVFTASAAPHFASAILSHVDITGSMLTAHVTDAHMQLKDGEGPDAKATPVLKMLRKALVAIDVPALEKLQVLMDSLSSPTHAKPLAGSAAASTDPSILLALARVDSKKPAPPAKLPTPTKLAGGSLGGSITFARGNVDQLVIEPSVDAKDLKLSKNEVIDLIGALAIRGQVDIAAMPTGPADSMATTQPTILEQIASLRFTDLTALGIGSGVKINGEITDLGHARNLKNIVIDLNYNSTLLWKAMVPMLSKAQQNKLKDSEASGNYDKKFLIAGSYPADKEFNEAIKSVVASGELQLDQFTGEGATLKSFVIPISLAHGKARIAYADKPEGQNLPAPAAFNDGKLDLSGAGIDLSDPHMTLTIPTGKKLLDSVNLNNVLASNVGDFINNPLFVGSDNAAGQMSVTINLCDRFPTDSSVEEKSPANSGVLDASIVISRLQIGNAFITKIAAAVGVQKFAGSLEGDVKNFQVHIANGVTKQDMTLTFGENKRPLHLFGDVAMQTREMNMTLDLPFALFKLPSQPVIGDGVKIPLSGPVTSPRFNMGAAFQQNLNLNNLPDLLGNKIKNDKPAPSTQPAQDNPVNDLLDIFGGKKKKKDNGQ